jgi:hypothetical protein
MSKHVTYRGVTIDMDSLRRENEKTPAIGNMKVNAKGDQLAQGGAVAKTAEQLARENHRVQSAIVATGLKGAQPDTSGINLNAQATGKSIKTNPVQPKSVTKTKEIELPSGDIIIEDDNESTT